MPAQDAWGLEFPGFDGLNLDPAPGKGMNRDAIRSDEADKYFFHFPDGNASIARLLVRKLNPRGHSWKLGQRCDSRQSRLLQARLGCRRRFAFGSTAPS